MIKERLKNIKNAKTIAVIWYSSKMAEITSKKGINDGYAKKIIYTIGDKSTYQTKKEKLN